MNARMNRRSVVGISSAVVASLALSKNILAQNASPVSHEHAVNPSRPMPEITVTLGDSALAFPPELQAGINKVMFENQSSGDGHVLTSRLPDDVDMDAFMADISDEDAPLPEYLRDQYFPGIPDYPAVGASNTAWINYMPGNYIALNIFGGQAPAMFSVVGNPWGVPPPFADHEIGMVEMTFVGLEEPVSAGEQVWSLINHGATWHEIMLIGMPKMQSAEELLEFFLSTEGESDLADAGYVQIGGSGIMSPGVQIWMDLNLEAGAYGALCFAPDDFTGPPHALGGMVSTFEVE